MSYAGRSCTMIGDRVCALSVGWFLLRSFDVYRDCSSSDCIRVCDCAVCLVYCKLWARLPVCIWNSSSGKVRFSVPCSMGPATRARLPLMLFHFIKGLNLSYYCVLFLSTFFPSSCPHYNAHLGSHVTAFKLIATTRRVY